MKLCGIFIFAALVFFSSCTTNGVYEKMAFFPKHEWSSSNKPSFDFEVNDSSASYRLYFFIRHTNAYRWNNIWLNISVKSPDTTFLIKHEVTLADNVHERWYGTSVDDIIEQRIPFDRSNTGSRAAPVQFLKKGHYTFTLQHIMREDPLQHVMNAGIRVEKVQ